MIAPHASVVVALCAFLGQPIGLADGGVQDRWSEVYRQVPPQQSQARASSSRLTRSDCRTWPHRKLRKKVPRVDGALTTQPSTRIGAASAQRVSIVDTVSASQCRRYQRQQLISCICPTRRISQVNVLVNQLAQAKTMGQSDRQQ